MCPLFIVYSINSLCMHFMAARADRICVSVGNTKLTQQVIFSFSSLQGKYLPYIWWQRSHTTTEPQYGKTEDKIVNFFWQQKISYYIFWTYQCNLWKDIINAEQLHKIPPKLDHHKSYYWHFKMLMTKFWLTFICFWAKESLKVSKLKQFQFRKLNYWPL